MRIEQNAAIRLEGLSKHFGRRGRRVEAVKAIDLAVAAGQVYGFLGPNGAGKTTTIRLILGLLRPTAGRVYLFGRDAAENHDVLVQQVGAMVESPSFYGHLSGRRNLEVLARTAGDYDAARIESVLAQVGLEQSANRQAGRYSTGMKQRLGLAAALLNDPDLLILDEPTNGLDPAGIRQMRTFIRELVDVHGKTVFLSSHLLHEVEQICDRVALLRAGEIVQRGQVQELLNAHSSLRLEARPVAEAVSLLQERWPVVQSKQWLTVAAGPDESPAILRHLLANGVDVFQIVVEKQSLEAVFLETMETEEGGDG